MGAKSGIALKTLQWFIRGIQFACSALILAIFSYFLATLHNHDLSIGTWIRAVEGISGAATLYTLIGLLLLCCLAGHPFTSFIAIVLDVCFVAAFIYVAVANRGGAGSCKGYVSTPFGSGDANTNVRDNAGDGFTALPTLRQACQMETACLAVAIVAIFFFVFSAFLEVTLVRHRRKEQRFGPSPANDYTSGYGKKGLGSFFGLRRGASRKTTWNENQLPQHTSPDEVRESYATEQQLPLGNGSSSTTTGSGVGGGAADLSSSPALMADDTAYEAKYGEPPAAPHANGYGYSPIGGTNVSSGTHNPYGATPANYRYGDGVYDA